MEIRLEPDRSLAKRWSFEAEFEMPGGHCSRVYADASCVLKVPFMGEEMTSGRTAALMMSGSIGPRIFESDEDSGALLMERLAPGSNIAESDLNEDQQLEVFLELAQRMRCLNVEFEKPISEMSRHDRALHRLVASPCSLMPLDEFLSNPSCPLIPDLLATSPEPVFLHGDLHHMNILQRGDEWLAIDPKGLIGDPAFEAAAFVRNPIPEIGDSPNLVEILRHRIERISLGLQVESKRIWAWSLVELWDNNEHGLEPWDIVKRALLEMKL